MPPMRSPTAILAIALSRESPLLASSMERRDRVTLLMPYSTPSVVRVLGIGITCKTGIQERRQQQRGFQRWEALKFWLHPNPLARSPL